MDEKEKQKMREDEIVQMVTSFCKERLDEEYEQLCEKLEKED